MRFTTSRKRPHQRLIYLMVTCPMCHAVGFGIRFSRRYSAPWVRKYNWMTARDAAKCLTLCWRKIKFYGNIDFLHLLVNNEFNTRSRVQVLFAVVHISFKWNLMYFALRTFQTQLLYDITTKKLILNVVKSVLFEIKKKKLLLQYIVYCNFLWLHFIKASCDSLCIVFNCIFRNSTGTLVFRTIRQSSKQGNN